MDSVYVIGHRNPDTDSIVSALAYASLQNALGENNYVAARIGHLNNETAFLLERSSEMQSPSDFLIDEL